jgi:HEAT repeat protein
MFPTKHLLAVVLLAGLPVHGLAETPSKPKPVSEADVLKLIELQRQTEAILARLSKAGVDFPVTDAVLERLRKAGASEKVLAALRSPPGAKAPLVKARPPEVKSPLVKALIKQLKDEDATVRRKAAETIVKLGAKEAVPALIEQLKDRDATVRRAAADTLGKLEAKEAVPALIQRVADDVWVQHPGLATFADNTPYDGIKDRRGSKDRALQVLAKLAPDKVEEALLLALKSKTYQVRAWAARELTGEKKSEPIVAALVAGLRDADGYVRRTAADSLGKLGAKEAVPALIKRVADDVWVQHPGLATFADSTPYDGIKEKGSKDRALQVLGKLAPDKVEEALVLAMKSKTYQVRSWAARELASEKKSEAIVAALVAGLRDSDAYVRRAAADTLGRLGAKEAVPALIKRVADDVWVQHPGFATIGDSTPYDGMKDRRGSKDRALQVLTKLAPEKVEEALTLALNSKKPEVKAWALTQIGKINEKK